MNTGLSNKGIGEEGIGEEGIGEEGIGEEGIGEEGIGEEGIGEEGIGEEGIGEEGIGEEGIGEEGGPKMHFVCTPNAISWTYIPLSHTTLVLYAPAMPYQAGFVYPLAIPGWFNERKKMNDDR